MYNHHNVFIIGDHTVQINYPEEFHKLLEDVFQKHELNSVFIKASYSSYGGANIYKIFARQLISERNTIDELYKTVILSGYQFQETIRQHTEMDRLNPSCVNTLRMDTFIDGSGNIEIITGYLRTSIKNSIVDNVAQGGGFIAIDITTGRLRAECYLEFLVDAGITLKQHPVTQVVFENFQIPSFKEAKELIIKAASCMPGLRLVGWDVGITETGPVLIEVNAHYSMECTDISAGGYLSQPIFRKVWQEVYPQKRNIW
jgi:hypothetical protein